MEGAGREPGTLLVGVRAMGLGTGVGCAFAPNTTGPRAGVAGDEPYPRRVVPNPWWGGA